MEIAPKPARVSLRNFPGNSALPFQPPPPQRQPDPNRKRRQRHPQDAVINQPRPTPNQQHRPDRRRRRTGQYRCDRRRPRHGAQAPHSNSTAAAATINPTDISVAMMFEVRFSFTISTSRPTTCAGPKQLAASVAIARLAPRS